MEIDRSLVAIITNWKTENRQPRLTLTVNRSPYSLLVCYLVEAVDR